MDDERLAIGKAYGIDLIDTLEQLKLYYGWNDTTSYYEYVHSPESPYYDLIGHNIKGDILPKMFHRFLFLRIFWLKSRA